MRDRHDGRRERSMLLDRINRIGDRNAAVGCTKHAYIVNARLGFSSLSPTGVIELPRSQRVE